MSAQRKFREAGRPSYVAASDDTIDRILSRDSAQSMSFGRLRAPIPCPCCSSLVHAPTIEIIVDTYKITPMQTRILRALWRGKGHPVMAERIFDFMYADDPDGGPSPGRMYQAFKVALHHLRKRLAGSGISIANVGYRRGYRLILDGQGA